MKKENFYDELFAIQNLLTDTFGKSVPDTEVSGNATVYDVSKAPKFEVRGGAMVDYDISECVVEQ